MSASWERAARRRLRLAATLIVLEAAALMAYTVVELASLRSGRTALGLSTAAFFGVCALGLGFATRGLLRRASWSRGLAVFAQLVQLGVAWSLRSTDVWPVAVALGAVALVVLVAVLSPSTTRALGE